MTAEQLLKLLDAGFTVDDLRPLLGSAPADNPAPDEGAGDPAPKEGAKDPTPEEAAQPEQATAGRLDKIEDLISQMASAIIKGTEAKDPKDERDNGIKGLLEGM